MWLCFRFITGCALGLSWIASEIWLNTISGEESRSTVMGCTERYSPSESSPALWLLELTSTEGWRPFLYGAVCLLATLLPLLVLRGVETPVDTRTPLAELLRSAHFAPIVMLAAVVAGLVESADLALLPLFGLHAGLNESAALLLVTLFMVGNVVLQMPIGLLADRFGRHEILAVCSVAERIGTLAPAALCRSACLARLAAISHGAEPFMPSTARESRFSVSNFRLPSWRRPIQCSSWCIARAASSARASEASPWTCGRAPACP